MVNALVPPPPCRSPPLVVPQGGVGDRHLVNPKFFVAAHCVVLWVTVLWGTATCIPLLAPAKPPTKKAKPPPKSAAQSIPVESGEHVLEFKVKWSRTKKFYTEPVKE